MKPLHFIIFLVTLPILISLGHDLYLFYVAQGEQLNADLLTKIYTEDRPARAFDFAALGFIWLEYSPDTYKMMAESFEPAEWAGIQEFLKLKATLVFAALAALVYALAFALYLFGKMRESGKKVSKRRRARMN